jgi:hypothetical protein
MQDTKFDSYDLDIAVSKSQQSIYEKKDAKTTKVL